MSGRSALAAAAFLGLSACAGVETGPPQPVTVKILAITDFHGRLEPPGVALPAPAPGGGKVQVPVGGAAYLASAVESLRGPNTVVVSAGDNVGASPLASNLFLDEPTIEALNLIGLDYTAVGNHEFDKGFPELLRLARGGCAEHTLKAPCRLSPGFQGARFHYLAANVADEAGRRPFPVYAIRSFGQGRAKVRVAFIGLALESTPANTLESAVKGVRFLPEAESANELVPELKRAGADAIVILVHDGTRPTGAVDPNGCGLRTGDFSAMLAKLDPAIDVVVSGHSHYPYVCPPGAIAPRLPILVANAGSYGVAVTEISLSIDPAAHRLLSKSAVNQLVQSEPYPTASGGVALTDAVPRYPPEPKVAALVARYRQATAELAAKPVGRLTAPAWRERTGPREPPLGGLVADGYLAMSRAPNAGGAQLAMTNPGGVRANLEPGPNGWITYGQIFAVQPFGNTLVVMGYTGRQLRGLLEKQFETPSPRWLQFSDNLRYRYDLSRPVGARVVEVLLDGQPLRDEAVYRLATNNFMAEGGEDFDVLREGVDRFDGPADIDVMERYFAEAKGAVVTPSENRAVDVTPPPAATAARP